MTTELAKPQDNIYDIMEKVISDGDLSKFTPKQRVEYYTKTCESLGLNPLTRPFEYQRFNNKVVLYARKEATEQLRAIHKVSIYKLEKERFEDVYLVTAYARTADGKEDVATGAVNIAGLKGEALSNAFMKAETKAKRRVTLSICGLGFTDESEIDSIPNSKPVKVDHITGEILDESATTPSPIAPPRQVLVDAIQNASSLDGLKKAYQEAYRIHAGNLEIMKDLTTLKDVRKTYLEKQIEDFKQELATAENA